MVELNQKLSDKYQEPVEGESEPTASEEKPQLEKEVSVPKEEEILELEKKLVEKKSEIVNEEKTDELGTAKEKPVIAEEKIIETESIKEVEPVRQESKPEEVMEKEAAPAPTSAPTSAPTPSVPSIQAQKQITQLKDLDRPSQVKALCDLAFQKGLSFAIEVAKTLDNAYVLDEFHDTLVSELYNELVEKGELKQP